jgi:hypothetical protein
MKIYSTGLNFKLSAQTKGLQKAYKNFIDLYGREEGNRIFLAKADERGSGKTLRQKANDVYKTGARLKK